MPRPPRGTADDEKRRLMEEMLIGLTGQVSDFLYTYILVILLVFTGVSFTIRTKAVQIRYIKDMLTQLTERKHVKGERSISSFQALMVSTASRVGTGNIAGIATAVATGGPGAVFWMWAMAVVGAASAFIESTLAQIWKVRGKDGEFRGGPAYYIERALGKRWLGVLFAILLIICYAYGFNGLQAFNMASALEYYIPDYATNGAAVALGIVLMVMTAFVIFGGSKRISVIASIIVPVMAIAYVGLAIAITVMNIGLLPEVFSVIFASAFDFQAIFGGFAGSVIMLGIKRGLFSNEAGMGSAPNAAATASVSHPVKQGLVQSLSVYIDTLVICTCSAFMVLIFYVQSGNTFGDLNGMPLVQMAVNAGVGEMGIHFVTFAIFAFAFSSLIGNYFYAEGNIRFITKSTTVLTVFRLTCLAAIMVGCLNNFTLAWNFADITMGFMAIVNLVAILLLGKWALKALDDYTAQRKRGEDPVFVADRIEGMPKTECWHVEQGRGLRRAAGEGVPRRGARRRARLTRLEAARGREGSAASAARERNRHGRRRQKARRLAEARGARGGRRSCAFARRAEVVRPDVLDRVLPRRVLPCRACAHVAHRLERRGEGGRDAVRCGGRVLQLRYGTVGSADAGVMPRRRSPARGARLLRGTGAFSWMRAVRGRDGWGYPRCEPRRRDEPFARAARDGWRLVLARRRRLCAAVLRCAMPFVRVSGASR